MWVLLILACIVIPYACFRFLTMKLQGFVGAHDFSDENRKQASSAIVLGKSELSRQVGKLLEEEGIHVTFMTEPDIQRIQGCKYLFALSMDDVDNVLMCRISEKVYDIKAVISICNDPKNERIFETGCIPFCSREGLTAQMLVQAVLTKKEAEICQKN